MHTGAIALYSDVEQSQPPCDAISSRVRELIFETIDLSLHRTICPCSYRSMFDMNIDGCSVIAGCIPSLFHFFAADK